MRYTEPILFLGMKDIKDNIQRYTDIFKKEGLIVFRDANLTYKEQEEIQTIFGEVLGYYPNKMTDQFDRYEENHSRLSDLKEIAKDKNIIKWHIENTWYDNPIVASVWNMLIFELDKDCGTTWFVDIIPIIKSLSDDDLDFLYKCKIQTFDYRTNLTITNRIFSNGKKLISNFFQKHWITGEDVPRIAIGLKNNQLYLVDGSSPTDAEIQRYQKITDYIVNEITNNTNRQIVHQWKKGDILIPDLHKMVHTVKGGIDPEKRKFTGLWAYQYNLHTHPRVDVEARIKDN
jgi:alpha-ketoglutarate-dependent taurine dioxygenase